jgi:serine/threonine protein kinase
MNAEAVRERSMIGQIVDGKYEIIGVLGAGGMAVVYEARDLNLRRRVALKLAMTEQRYSLQREAQALAAIRHPGFATIYHAGFHGDAEYIAMERIFGETLSSHLEELTSKGRMMPLDDAVDVLIGVTDALSAAHRAGVAQRDLKPGNIILAGDRVVLVDFGLFIPEVLVSPDNEISGTPEYLAPEVISRTVMPGEGPLIDLYSLGILAFELLTNATPFADESLARVISRHMAAEPPDVAARRPIPAELATLVSELLAKDPHERPPSAEAVLWQLKHVRDRGHRMRRGLSVVAIDDDIGVGSALKRSLESLFPGLAVQATSSYEPKLRDSAPDVVLVDLHMPDKNGLEVCMDLLSLPESRRPLIVAMSANAAAKDVAVLRAVGVRHFVPKDENFVSALSKLIARVRNGETNAPSSFRA